MGEDYLFCKSFCLGQICVGLVKRMSLKTLRSSKVNSTSEIWGYVLIGCSALFFLIFMYVFLIGFLVKTKTFHLGMSLFLLN